MRMGKSANKRYMAFVDAKRHRLSRRDATLKSKCISWTVGRIFYTCPIDKHTQSDLKFVARYRCGTCHLKPYSSPVDYFKDSSRMHPPFYLMRHNEAKRKFYMDIISKLSKTHNFRSEKKKAAGKKYWDSIFGRAS